MAKISQEEFIAAFNAVQKETIMELEMTPAYRNALTKNLEFESAISLGISPKEFQELYIKTLSDEPCPFNGYELALLSNTLEKRTMQELKMGQEAYFEIQLESQSHSNEWNNIFIPIQHAIYEGNKV